MVSLPELPHIVLDFTHVHGLNDEDEVEGGKPSDGADKLLTFGYRVTSRVQDSDLLQKS